MKIATVNTPFLFSMNASFTCCSYLFTNSIAQNYDYSVQGHQFSLVVISIVVAVYYKCILFLGDGWIAKSYIHNLQILSLLYHILFMY